MRNSLLLLAGIGLASACGAAAQRPDANGDKVTTRAEAAQRADARFAAMDANRDGTVTPEERRAERERMRDQRDRRVVTKEQFEDRAERRFDRMDANDDGKLTGDERRTAWAGAHGPGGPMRGRAMGPETAAAFRQRALDRFDRMDTNHDGRLDQAERDAARERMGPPPRGDVPPPPAY